MRLAEAGAFASFQGQRRAAMWQARGHARSSHFPLPLQEKDEMPAFRSLNAFEAISWDYRTSDHSARGHPLAPMRKQLAMMNLPDAKTVNAFPDGKPVRYAGMVICRQRPGTASGLLFISLEDESGFVNVVVWSRIFEKYKLLIKTTSFLGVSGKLQVQDGVVHLVARSFWIPPLKVKPESGGSHDFH